MASDGFKSATIEPDQIEKRFAEGDKYNLAIRTGENTRGLIVVIDVDDGEGKPGPATLAALEKRFGKLPPTLVQVTGSGGHHYVFTAKLGSAIKSGTNVLRAEAGLQAKDANGKATKSGIDVRAENGYIMVEPSNHTKGKYHWTNYSAEIAPLPEWLERALTTPQHSVSAEIVRSPSIAEKDQPHETLTLLQVRELLNSIPSDDRDTWLIFGNVLKTIAPWIGGEDDAFRMWTDWSASGEGFQGEKDQAYHWASFNNPTQHPVALLKKHASEYGWVCPRTIQ